MTTGKIEYLCTYYTIPGHQFPAPWQDVHRSSDGAHQLSGGAIELHLQGSPVADQKQQCPAPGFPVGRGPAGVGLGVGLREIVGRGVAPHCSSVAGHLERVPRFRESHRKIAVRLFGLLSRQQLELHVYRRAPGYLQCQVRCC